MVLRDMVRRRAITARAALLCLLAAACEGNGALFLQDPVAQETVAPSQPNDAPTPAPSQPSPGEPLEEEVAPPDEPPPVASVPDAGVPLDTPPDAGAVPAPPRDVIRDVIVDGPAAVLSLLGVVGGDPRLAACEGGVIVGVRTTANPSTNVFGQRLTFIEPICGKVLQDTVPQDTVQGDADGLRVTRDDSLVAWAVTNGFFGLPATEVPDPTLLWVPQPETVCPDATPVVVGLSGEYDPAAPDVPDTAAIRSLFIECAPLVVAPDGVAVTAAETGHQLISNADAFASPGVSSYRSACESGTVMTQIQVHAGFWLDGFVLGCSSLRID
jgi:hypothetical protein